MIFEDRNYKNCFSVIMEHKHLLHLSN